MQEAFLLLESRLTFVSLNITGTAAASICFAEYHRNCSSINSMSGPAMCVPRSGKLVWLTLIELASAGRCLKQVHKSIAAFMCSANASCSVHVGLQHHEQRLRSSNERAIKSQAGLRSCFSNQHLPV